jgi:hypothetical protein
MRLSKVSFYVRHKAEEMVLTVAKQLGLQIDIVDNRLPLELPAFSKLGWFFPQLFS